MIKLAALASTAHVRCVGKVSPALQAAGAPGCHSLEMLFSIRDVPRLAAREKLHIKSNGALCCCEDELHLF